MILRVRCVSLAVLAWLTAASACIAAEPNYAPRKGGVGGSLGLGQVLGQGDYSEDSRPRFSFAGQFRYVMTPAWRWQFGPGLAWAAYKKGAPAPYTDINFPTQPAIKDDYLTLVVPVSAQLQYVQRRGPWMYHAGAGPGLYRMWVQNRRKVLRDPFTHDLHRGLYPGFTIEFGGERFLKNITTTSIELSSATHFVLARRDDQFPSGFNGSVRLTDFRVGVNYYFDLVRAKRTGGSLPGLPRQ
jgi:hypothetical protein